MHYKDDKNVKGETFERGNHIVHVILVIYML